MPLRRLPSRYSCGVLGRRRRRGVLYRFDDVHVTGAATDVAADSPANLVLGRVWIALDERRADQHHARGAETALQPVLRVEPLLDGVQLSAGCKPLDRGDLPAVDLGRQYRAGL